MSVSIYNDNFEITKYYSLGLIPIKWRFCKNADVEIFPLRIASEMHHPAVESATDSWLGIFTIFFPKQKITHYTLIIKYLKKNNLTAQIQENFTVKEFKLIINIMKEKVVYNNFNNDTL